MGAALVRPGGGGVRINPMAQKTVVLFEGDLDGGEAAGTLRFALEGVAYEIDLSENNAANLRAALAPYVQAGRRICGRRATGPSAPRVHAGGATKKDPAQLAAIRDWGRRRGLDIKERTHLPRHRRPVQRRHHASAD